MDDTDKRLTAIRAKAEEMGWSLSTGEFFQDNMYDIMKPTWKCCDSVISMPEGDFYFNSEHPDTAERLLAALEPGPVVEIRHAPAGICHPRCNFAYNTCPFSSNPDKQGRIYPSHKCPGPAKLGHHYELIEVRDATD